MYRKKAVDLFSQRPRRYNCAQAIAKAFQDTLDVPEELVSKWARVGNGKAENGLCGALYAAMELVDCPDTAQKLENRFADIVGSAKCKEIRKARQVSCAGCVEQAAGILQEKVG